MSKFVDAIIGHAVGDAMGVPTEFKKREDLLNSPVTEMIETPDLDLPAGTWSDDTSMEIATIISFIEKGEFDYDDIFTKWSKWVNEGNYTATGRVFDVGRTCLSAILNYERGVPSLECGKKGELYNGNGSLMRILPVAFFAYAKNLNDEQIIKLSGEISSLTHADMISQLGCYIYVKFIMALLSGMSKEEAYEYIKNVDYTYYDQAVSKYERILKHNIKDYKLSEIKSSGYIVDTLECVYG